MGYESLAIEIVVRGLLLVPFFLFILRKKFRIHFYPKLKKRLTLRGNRTARWVVRFESNKGNTVIYSLRKKEPALGLMLPGEETADIQMLDIDRSTMISFDRREPIVVEESFPIEFFLELRLPDTIELPHSEDTGFVIKTSEGIRRHRCRIDWMP